MKDKEKTTTTDQIKSILDIQVLAKQIARKEFFYNLLSPQTDELTKAICGFKLEMPELKTDKTAGGRYKYQSLPNLLSAITPVLAKHGCSLMQPVHTIGDVTYVVTLIMHTSGQHIRSVTALPDKYTMAGKLVNTDENLQAMGGAITYTKRHALKAMLGVDADEDTDGNSPYVSQNPAFRDGNRFNK